MFMASLPIFALSGDCFHGTGQPRSLDAWWSALALGAQGLACEASLVSGIWYCGDASSRYALLDFLRSFGSVCPLTVSLSVDSLATPEQVRELATLLAQGFCRHGISFIGADAHVQAIANPGPLRIYTLNRYGDAAATSTRQALGLDAALRQFPTLTVPGAPSGQHLLLTEIRPSGLPVAEAWLVTDFGNPDFESPMARLLHETFDGAQRAEVEGQWSLGYSNLNNESQLSLQAAGSVDGPGLQLVFPEGALYSGGAAVLRMPVMGDFDARTGFSCSPVNQGCTLEMAVITIDPPPMGWTETDRQKLDPANPASAKKISLVFDVHGTPPYVSAECDEDNGFRIGWNRSFTLTEFAATATRGAQSSNLYNRYGADVAAPAADAGPHDVKGELRLVRRAGFFATYFRQAGQTQWQCSGTLFNEQLPSQMYLRLGAKHWKKKDKAPAATVRFHDFELLSPIPPAL